MPTPLPDSRGTDDGSVLCLQELVLFRHLFFEQGSRICVSSLEMGFWQKSSQRGQNAAGQGLVCKSLFLSTCATPWAELPPS